MSLRVLMFLSSKQFAAMLLTAGLVSVNKSNQVSCSHRVWETFIPEGDIPHYNPQKHNSNCIETTFSRIDSTCFVLNPVREPMQVVLVRIGKNTIGESTTASMMLNDGCEPPTRLLLCITLTEFNASLSPLIQEIMSKNNSHLQTVMDCVDMEQIRQTIKVTHATEPAQDNAQTVT